MDLKAECRIIKKAQLYSENICIFTTCNSHPSNRNSLYFSGDTLVSLHKTSSAYISIFVFNRFPAAVVFSDSKGKNRSHFLENDSYLLSLRISNSRCGFCGNMEETSEAWTGCH